VTRGDWSSGRFPHMIIRLPRMPAAREQLWKATRGMAINEPPDGVRRWAAAQRDPVRRAERICLRCCSSYGQVRRSEALKA